MPPKNDCQLLGSFPPLPVESESQRQVIMLTISPYVVITVWIVFRFSRFDEPRMLVARVVHDEIHDDLSSRKRWKMDNERHLQATFVSFGEETIEIFHRAKFGVDPSIVRDVIAIVLVGRWIDRRHPDHIHAETLDIVQRADYAFVVSEWCAGCSIHLPNHRHHPHWNLCNCEDIPDTHRSLSTIWH